MTSIVHFTIHIWPALHQCFYFWTHFPLEHIETKRGGEKKQNIETKWGEEHSFGQRWREIPIWATLTIRQMFDYSITDTTITIIVITFSKSPTPHHHQHNHHHCHRTMSTKEHNRPIVRFQRVSFKTTKLWKQFSQSSSSSPHHYHGDCHLLIWLLWVTIRQMPPPALITLYLLLLFLLSESSSAASSSSSSSSTSPNITFDIVHQIPNLVPHCG